MKLKPLSLIMVAALCFFAVNAVGDESWSGYRVSFRIDSGGNVYDFDGEAQVAAGTWFRVQNSGPIQVNGDYFSVGDYDPYNDMGANFYCTFQSSSSIEIEEVGISGGERIEATVSASGNAPNGLGSLTISPSTTIEDAGVLVGAGTVYLDTVAATAARVRLYSSDTDVLTVPPSVTIPAGSSSATFNVTIIDDSLSDGTQTATITARFLGGSQNQTVTVLDDEPDTVRPTVTSWTPIQNSTIGTNEGVLNVDVTFSEPVTGVDAFDMELSGAAAVGASVGAPSDLGGNEWRFPVSGFTVGTFQIDLAPDPGDIEDLAGNDLSPRPTTWSYTMVPSYTITTLAGANGAISPENPSVVQGQDQSVSMQPDAGYYIESVTVDGIPVVPVVSSYYFSNVQSNHTIAATFAAHIAYVDAARPNDFGDGRSWVTAKKTIQSAVDLVEDGGMIWVTNGIYNTGGIRAPRREGDSMNRICITKPITVQSMNGPNHTFIIGAEASGGGNGSNAVRGVYMSAGMLCGFTITNGHTVTEGYDIYQSGGGVCENGFGEIIISNCVITGNSANIDGGGSYGGTLNNCTLTRNSASYGGGSSEGTLHNCVLTENTADNDGGGSYGSWLYNCTIRSNTASNYGGGCRSYDGVLENCMISGNSARYGGGWSGNSYSILKNCVLTGNTAEYGGGSRFGTLNNCTLTGNSATYGGGSSGCTLNNCIIYYNSASASGDNWSEEILYYSCTTPDPGGTGNITNAPLLVSSSHIASNSPCIGMGSADYATGTDIDGEVWLNPPSIGCDEHLGFGSVTGTISATLIGPAVVLEDYTEYYVPVFNGSVTMTTVNFGNDLVLTNPVGSIEVSWPVPGVAEVLMTGYNEDHPDGITSTQLVEVLEEDAGGVYVSISTGDDASNGLSWATAKQTIQAGVDAQYLHGGMVWISNGNYSISSQIVIDKEARVIGVDGPVIDGGGNTRCFYLGDSCVLSGFIITNGYSTGSGGGIYCSSTMPIVTNCVISGNSSASYGGGSYNGTLNNCLITGNSAENNGGGSAWSTLYNCSLSNNSASSGGGSYYGTLNSCILTGNSADDSGGGSFVSILNNSTLSGNSASKGGGSSSSTLNNCTLSGNLAYIDGGGSYGGSLNNCTLSGNFAGDDGGGCDHGILRNCIIYYNTANGSGDNWYDRSPDFSYCCTTPGPGGTGNITNAPLLVSASHIATNSPCIGMGSVDYATGEDIDGDVWLNPPSIGCDEIPDHGNVTGTFSATLIGPASVVEDCAASYTPLFYGPVTKTIVDFGNGFVVTNSTGSIETSWPFPGSVEVLLTGFNDNHPGGITFTQLVEVLTKDDHAIYVAASSGNDANDGLSWTTAKQTIQAGVDSQDLCGGTVWVSNGVYASGGGESPTPSWSGCDTRVVVLKDVHIRSVNGSEHTFIVGEEVAGGGNGSDAVRGVYMFDGTLSGFTITNGHTTTTGDYNYDRSGGGINVCGGSGVISNCVLLGNSAHERGGGSAYGTLNNCTISGNSARYGGGSAYGTLNNCTISGNSAHERGGGSAYGTLNNCIVWYNKAGVSSDNRTGGTANHSCAPELEHGIDGNITNAPLLVSASHITSNSPCRGAGSVTNTSGTDIDGEVWFDPPAMGCDEYHEQEALTGSIQLSLSGPTNICADYTGSYCVGINGKVIDSSVDFGDGYAQRLIGWTSHEWNLPGIYDVVLTAWNYDNPDGVSFTQKVHVVSPEESAVFVSASTGNDTNDGRSWAAAKQTIQAGVDSQNTLGGIVWVTNGVYNTGGAITPGYECSNRVCIANAMVVQSVNGPDTALIIGAEATGGGNGSDAVRGVYMSAGVLSGFTITNGHTMTSGSHPYNQHGGGVNMYGGSGVVSNCVLSGNSASFDGGGSAGGRLYNSTLTENSAADDGGGSVGSVLYNCTLSDNSAVGDGGGIFGGSLRNCIVYYNSATNSGDNWYDTTPNFSYSCTNPHPGGTGNITNNPQFVNVAIGNYRLAVGSYCINAGHNDYAPTGSDLDGNPRVAGGVVDMGAYERQDAGTDVDADNMDDLWEMTYLIGRHFANTNDICSNGVNTVLEAYLAGLDPTDTDARFELSGLGNELWWNSVSGRVYAVHWTTNLLEKFQPLETNIPWTVGGFTDAAHSNEVKAFYKLKVEME